MCCVIGCLCIVLILLFNYGAKRGMKVYFIIYFDLYMNNLLIVTDGGKKVSHSVTKDSSWRRG